LHLKYPKRNYPKRKKLKKPKNKQEPEVPDLPTEALVEIYNMADIDSIRELAISGKEGQQIAYTVVNRRHAQIFGASGISYSAKLLDLWLHEFLKQLTRIRSPKIYILSIYFQDGDSLKFKTFPQQDFVFINRAHIALVEFCERNVAAIMAYVKDYQNAPIATCTLEIHNV
jgi:hypothetical protein